MLRTLFRSRAVTRPRVPAGKRVYAIGDVHGRDDLLEQLLTRIEEDHRARGEADALMVFLGDLIDRGPGSAQVLARLRGYAPDGITPYFLLGNHEEVLLRLLGGDALLVRDWLRFGGAECAASYGLDPAELKRLPAREAAARIREAIPQEDSQFLAGFDETLRVGDYLFVHAGIRPGRPLASQAQSDLRWIRAPFLDCDDDHGFVVVHGHTISPEVDRRHNRIGIDTGAYATGTLTALGLEGDEQWLIQS